jgi:hypothetical protein
VLPSWEKFNAPNHRKSVNSPFLAPDAKRMLTIFATPKPFRGHNGIIQRNAIGSWVRLHPDCEVILFGDEAGAAEVAEDLGVRHVPDVLRSEFGTKRLDYIFARAQEMARHDRLCYANCDMILLPSFCQAVDRVARWSPKFLMIGRRWDTPLTQKLDFEPIDWASELREFATRSGKQQLTYAVDFFAFSRGLYADVPPFVVGRVYWDHWMVWKARSMKVPVVDATADVLAVHQNHDFAYHPGGLQGIKTDAESKRNRALAGGQLHLYTIDHATHRLIDGLIVDKSGRWHVPLTFLLRVYSSQFWYWLLKATFRARHALGLNRGAFEQVQKRVRSFIEE